MLPREGKKKKPGSAHGDPKTTAPIPRSPWERAGACREESSSHSNRSQSAPGTCTSLPNLALNRQHHSAQTWASGVPMAEETCGGRRTQSAAQRKEMEPTATTPQSRVARGPVPCTERPPHNVDRTNRLSATTAKSLRFPPSLSCACVDSGCEKPNPSSPEPRICLRKEGSRKRIL